MAIDNEAGIVTGWLPGERVLRGRELALELGQRSAVYVSDLRRAVQTAEIALAGTDMPINQDQRLREGILGSDEQISLMPPSTGKKAGTISSQLGGMTVSSRQITGS